MVQKIARSRVRKLQSNNTGTMTVSLPVDMVRMLGWKRGQKVKIRRLNTKMTIEAIE